jgi:chemotaxis signal transduction protein
LTAAAGATLLRCDAGGQSFCLDAALVRAIHRGDRLDADGGGDGGRLGRLDGAGEAVPVYSLAARLGLPAPAAPGAIVVVAGGVEPPWGLAVERVGRAVLGADAVALPLPALARGGAGWFAGAVRLGERLALLLAPERLRPGAAGTAAPAANGGPPAPAPAAAAPRPAAAGRPRALMLFSTFPGGRQSATLFGLSLAQIEEVLRPTPVTRVPGAPGDLLGLVPWRDQVVPVVDLSQRLGTGPSFFEGASRLLVVRGVRRPEWVAFPVRPDLRVQPLPLPSRAWADGARLASVAALGVFEVAAGTVVVPDVDQILTPDRADRPARTAAAVGS